MRRQETPDWSKSSMSNRDVVSVTNMFLEKCLIPANQKADSSNHELELI